MPDLLSPKSKYLITIDITIILAALMNQHGTTGPTSTSTSTNDNLNKEERVSAKDRKESGLV